MELSLLILVCIHKSYILHLEIYVVLIGHRFPFFGHGKVMDTQCLKRGDILSLRRSYNIVIFLKLSVKLK